jgi:hypothetical protein
MDRLPKKLKRRSQLWMPILEHNLQVRRLHKQQLPRLRPLRQ